MSRDIQAPGQWTEQRTDQPPAFPPPCPAPLLLVILPPGVQVAPAALRRLADHVRHEYGAGVSLRRRGWQRGGCRLELKGNWGTVSGGDVQDNLAHFWATLWDE